MASKAISQYVNSLDQALNRILQKYWEALPHFGGELISERATSILINEMQSAAETFLKKAVRSATRMEKLALKKSQELALVRDATRSELFNFVKCLQGPLLPVRLRSQVNGWSSIDPLIEKVTSRLEMQMEVCCSEHFQAAVEPDEQCTSSPNKERTKERCNLAGRFDDRPPRLKRILTKADKLHRRGSAAQDAHDLEAAALFFSEALKLYKSAGEEGDVEAQLIAGIMCANGRGTSADDAESAKWFLMAAERGDDEAQYMLGVQYFRGEGVPQDFSRAYQWLMLAARTGYDRPNDYLPKVRKCMTRTQLSKAKALVKNWKPKQRPPGALPVDTIG